MIKSATASPTTGSKPPAAPASPPAPRITPGQLETMMETTFRRVAAEIQPDRRVADRATDVPTRTPRIPNRSLVQFQRFERPCLDAHTPLGLTSLPCQEHAGAHRQIAIKHFDRERGQVTTASHCSVCVWLEFLRMRVRSGHFADYVHFMFPNGWPDSPAALEKALQ